MALWEKYKVKKLLTDRAPKAESLLGWSQKEVLPLLLEIRRVLNWAVDWLGKVGVDATDTPANLETKVLPGTGVLVTKTGVAGTRTLTLSADIGAIDSMKVAVDAIDLPTPKYLLASIANGTHLNWSLSTAGGVRQVRGDVEWPVIISPDPEVEGTWLFPCVVEDPLFRPSIDGVLSHGGGADAPFGTDYVAVSGICTWKTDTDRVLYLRDSAGSPTIAATAGMRFAYYNPLGGQPQYFGTYEVLVSGSSSNPAVFRRTTDANTSAGLCHGMTFQVVHTGAEYNGEYFTVDTSDPITVDTTSLTLSHSSSFTPADQLLALTGPQLISEGASEDIYDYNQTATASTVDFAELFLTLDNTPGVDTIPAGRVTFVVYAYVETVPVSPSVTTIIAYLQLGPTFTTILTAESRPIVETGATVIEIQADLAAPVSCSPTDKIRVKYAVKSTVDATIAHIVLEYHRYTRVQLTFAMNVAGSHPLLTGRDVANQHPWNAMEAKGRADFPIGTATSTSGLIVIADGYQQARVADSSTVMHGIDTTGFNDGAWVTLFFWAASPTNEIVLKNSSGSAVTPIYPFYLPALQGETNGQDWTLDQPTTLEFWLDKSIGACWRLRSIPAGSCS